MSNKYDDSEKGGFSYEEKLALVAQEQMAPEEIGLTNPEQAKLQLLPPAKKKFVFGTTLIFRAGTVPPELRAEWAYQEQKIIMSPADAARFKADYIAEHEHEYPVQGDLCCGNANARFSQTFKDPVLGLCQMLRIAADTLEAKYTEAPEAEQEQEPATTETVATEPPAKEQQDEPTDQTQP